MKIGEEVEATKGLMLLLSISPNTAVTAKTVMKARLKEIVKPQIIWKGDRIQCMKSVRTMQCKICMVERREILHRFNTEKK